MPKSAFPFYRRCYGCLLHLYPQEFHARYAESMRQTFGDLLRERAVTSQGIFVFALGLFAETAAGIVRQNFSYLMKRFSSLLRLVLFVLLLLGVPFVAMKFTDEVRWSASDFIVAGGLLFGAGLVYLWITQKFSVLGYRLAAGVAVLTALALLWVNIAVGIIGDEANPVNLLYLGVLAIASVTALLSRFQARGMAKALLATATAQGAVALSSVATGHPRSALVDLCFIVLWLTSAALFFRCAERPPESAPREPV